MLLDIPEQGWGPFQIQYTFIDLDGTLRLPPNESLPGYAHLEHAPAFNEIIQLSRAGKTSPMGICTGREKPYVDGFSDSWGFPDIMEGGVLTGNRATGLLYYHPAITLETRQLFVHLYRDVFPSVVAGIPDLHLYTGKEISIAVERKRDTVSIAELARLLLDPLHPALQPYADKLEYDYSDRAIDFRPIGVNKGTAFKEFCTRQKIDPGKVLSIDDSRGGFSIMDEAGYIGCPSNASEECKQRVRSRGEHGHVSDYPLLAGVIDILRHFLKV